MFDVIEFLENVGQDARLRYSSSDEVSATLAGQQMDSMLRNALIAQDAQGLGAALGKEVFCCYINPAKEDGVQDDKGGNRKTKKTPSKGPKQ
jgi:hypothetical protein